MGLISIDNERDILNQIANSDEQAFTVLFNGYVHQTGKIVYAITGSKEQTEEIVQDVFLKVWNERAKLPAIQKFNAYLFILLRNHTINYINKLITERKHQQQYSKFILHTPDQPETAATHEHLEKAIERLPSQQKTVFLLRAQGYKNPEIADKMNLSTDSVKKYNQLALKFLQRMISIKVHIAFAIFLFKKP
ncbi:RNA polymerase sigma-70 factor, ECF subfamily [Chitinophaga jiangningensis]|uniref:RNA polymerase sigma-70 factor, ECF subfamily n=1 Tax=Chitinophaga jiangningensis TaxID=1419482 RepID=A0A1M7J192_9BACT|nr:sigma-70 family RNA polymerase sigma factor [Chitinophaga jiangningensis]SHM46834.1 RNA polymerase sigma-70 factor, ECF subfamily [Chitinophaga jiangningensis]